VTARPLRSPVAWLGSLVVLYLGLPLAAFAVRFLSAPSRGFGVPGLFPALWVSLVCATISLGLITLFGVPLAYVLARSKGRAASVAALVVQIPLALPPIMAGIVLIYVVGPYTFLGRLFGGHLTDSTIGIVLAMTFCSAPFLIVTARSSFAMVDQGLLDVAATLGHSEFSRFMRVAVPMAGPGIRGGMLLAWLRAFGEYGAVIILAYNPASLPVYTYNQFSGRGLPTTLAPTALALGVAVVVVMISRVKFPRTDGARASASAARAPSPSPTQPVRFAVDHHLGSFHLELSHDSGASHLAVLGPSGSGKSALLRCLVGLYGREPGPVWYGDQPVQDVAVEQRRVGYVAQGFSLYPHLTVWRHLLFARGATPELAAYWLSHLRLDDLESRYPSELSGGQRQRVGLAQVLCENPQVLLLDEPFSALDLPVRLELRRELRRLQHETGLATVLVTHDPEEAAFLSEEVIVMANGRALQSGASREVFTRPASPEVARLLGIANMHHAVVASRRRIDAHGVLIAVGDTEIATGTPVLWSVRPERVSVIAAPGQGEPTIGERSGAPIGTVRDIADVGVAVDLFITMSPLFELQARVVEPGDLRVGDRCRVEIAPSAISLWAQPSQGEEAVGSYSLR
jgi:molybdate transport system permease protein